MVVKLDVPNTSYRPSKLALKTALILEKIPTLFSRKWTIWG